MLPMPKRQYINITSMYEVFKIDGGKLTKRQYSDIIYEFMEELVNLIITTNHIFIMPHSLGAIRIREKMLRVKIVDGVKMQQHLMNFNETKKLWARDPEAKEKGKRVYYLNEDNDGKIYSIVWDRGLSMIGYRKADYILNAFTFKSNKRKFRNALAQYIKKNPHKAQYFS
jgi:hypothetical protein